MKLYNIYICPVHPIRIEILLLVHDHKRLAGVMIIDEKVINKCSRGDHARSNIYITLMSGGK